MSKDIGPVRLRWNPMRDTLNCSYSWYLWKCNTFFHNESFPEGLLSLGSLVHVPLNKHFTRPGSMTHQLLLGLTCWTFTKQEFNSPSYPSWTIHKEWLFIVVCFLTTIISSFSYKQQEGTYAMKLIHATSNGNFTSALIEVISVTWGDATKF